MSSIGDLLRGSRISSPLTKMTQETSNFEWSKACEKSIQELNKRLTTALILNLPEGTQGFVGVL